MFHTARLTMLHLLVPKKSEWSSSTNIKLVSCRTDQEGDDQTAINF